METFAQVTNLGIRGIIVQDVSDISSHDTSCSFNAMTIEVKRQSKRLMSAPGSKWVSNVNLKYVQNKCFKC